MFPYRVQYTESESDIQNYNFFYKIANTVKLRLIVWMFFRSFQSFQFFENLLTLLAYFVKQIVILNIGFGFCVLNSIWEHTLNVFLTFFRRRRRVPSSSSSSVRPSVPSSVPSSSSVVVVRRRRPSSVVVVRRRLSKYYLQV